MFHGSFLSPRHKFANWPIWGFSLVITSLWIDTSRNLPTLPRSQFFSHFKYFVIHFWNIFWRFYVNERINQLLFWNQLLFIQNDYNAVFIYFFIIKYDSRKQFSFQVSCYCFCSFKDFSGKAFHRQYWV